MLLELCVRAPRHIVGVDALVDDDDRVHPFFAAARQADHRRIAHAWQLIQHALDVFRKHVQPFRRDDHLLLAAPDEQLAFGGDLADVAGVEPAVLECPRGFVRRVEIAGRHVLAAHQDLSVGRD